MEPATFRGLVQSIQQKVHVGHFPQNQGGVTSLPTLTEGAEPSGSFAPKEKYKIARQDAAKQFLAHHARKVGSSQPERREKKVEDGLSQRELSARMDVAGVEGDLPKWWLSSWCSCKTTPSIGIVKHTFPSPCFKYKAC